MNWHFPDEGFEQNKALGTGTLAADKTDTVEHVC